MRNEPTFCGITHQWRDFGDTCQEWRPTAEYKAWVDAEWPRRGFEEQVRLGWIKKGGRLYAKVAREEGIEI